MTRDRCALRRLCHRRRRAGARPIRRGRSPWWCRSRPAGRPTPSRASWPSACASSLGQTIIVENTTGAGRHASASAGSCAPRPTATRISIGHWGTHVVNGAIYPLHIRSAQRFRAGLADAEQSAADRRRKKPCRRRTCKELVAWLKANPDKVSAGTGRRRRAASHISGIYFQKRHRHQVHSSCRIAAPARRCRTWWPARST